MRFASIAVALLSLLLASCVPPAMSPAASAPEPGSHKTIVVCKIELDPPLQKNEQHFKWNELGTGQFENKVLLLTDQEYRQVGGDPELSDYKNRMELKLGETGYFMSENEPFYVLAGLIMMSMSPVMQKMYLPGGYKVPIRPGDQAVYIGTIRYHRDEFSEITKIEVIDDFRAERKRFYAKFGNGIKLKKRLITGK